MPPAAGGPGLRTDRGPSCDRRGSSPSGAQDWKLPPARGLSTSSLRVIITIGHLEWIRGKLVGVRVVVTEIGWDGNMRRWVPGTAGLTGADRWDNIMEQILPPRRTAQLRAVLPMSRTTVASLIRSRCDPAAGRTPEPSSAPRPRRLGEHRRSDGRQGRPASETRNDRTEVPALSGRLRSRGWRL